MGSSLDQAQALYDLQRFQEAIEALTQVIAADPNESQAFALRGAARLALADNQLAESDIRTAIRLAPESAQAHYLMSFVWINRNNLWGAARSIKECIRIEPTIAAYIQEARILLGLNKPNEAIESTRYALSIDPRAEDAYIVQAEIQMSLGRVEEAEANLKEALAIHPENPDAHRLLGIHALLSDRNRAATTSLTESRRISPIFHSNIGPLTVAYARSIWPFNLFRLLSHRYRSLPAIGQWLLKALVATSLVGALVSTQASLNRFSPIATTIFIAVGILAVVVYCAESASIMLAIFLRPKRLGVRRRDYLAQAMRFGAAAAVMAAVATGFAFVLTLQPVFALLMFLIGLNWRPLNFLWLNETLLANIVKGLVAIMLVVVCIVALFWIPTARSMMLAWLTLLVASAAINIPFERSLPGVVA